MKFLNNDWGWDVEETPPFLAFRSLRRKAVERFGEANILDISQGEPGYGFAPSERGRRFFSFLLLADTVLNNNRTDSRFGSETEESFPNIEKTLCDIIETHYAPEFGKVLQEDLEDFLFALENIFQKQGIPKTRFEILFDLFKFSVLSGGRYPNPWGEMVTRMAIAEEHSNAFGFPVSFEDIVLLLGASQGVGMFFKSLGEEGVGFLQEGDTLLMISPVYAPYMQFAEDRKLHLLSISINPETGEVDEESIQNALHSPKRIKAIILIDPNNPTGFPLEKKVLESITDIAEKHNSIILTDEVYAHFFPKKESISKIERAKKRTIHLDAISKIERSTGVRLGSLYLAPEARYFIAQKILEPECPGFLEKYSDMRWFLFLAKSFGGRTIGVFQHISGVPGPSQILGLCHLLLGKKERKEYVDHLRKKVLSFYSSAGLPEPKNMYYGIIDISKIEGSETREKPIEQVLTELAVEGGLIVMPAHKFFPKQDQEKQNTKRLIRVSLPNLSYENTKKAGAIFSKLLRK